MFVELSLQAQLTVQDSDIFRPKSKSFFVFMTLTDSTSNTAVFALPNLNGNSMDMLGTLVG